jgi:hypothetical protein
MRQILIVANQTVGSEALAEAVRTRMAAGPCQFVLLVPATERADYSSAASAVAIAEGGAVWARPPADAPDPARNRLRDGLGWLHHLGAATAKGEVGDKNPIQAIRTSLQRKGRQVDEIIISTADSSMSARRHTAMDEQWFVDRHWRLGLWQPSASAGARIRISAFHLPLVRRPTEAFPQSPPAVPDQEGDEHDRYDTKNNDPPHDGSLPRRLRG